MLPYLPDNCSRITSYNVCYTKLLRFGEPARLLHWLTFLLLLGSFGLGLTMVELPVSPQKLKFYSWHKWIGVTVFFLVIVRLGWHMMNVQPGYPARMPAWEP